MPSRHRPCRRSTPLLLGVLAGIALAGCAGGPGRGTWVPAQLVQHPAPPFTRPLASLKGGEFSLRTQHGHPVLLSFLNTQADPTAANDASRAETVFIKSMNTQNYRYGLRTVIIDAADAAGTSPPSRDALVNFAFDWALGASIAVVGDENGSLERAYGVTKTPTTFLIDKRGIVRHRWVGFALAAQLDFAIRPLVGRNIFESGP